MITKEKIKKEIDQLSDTQLEKVYLYLTSLKQKKKKQVHIRSLRLGGKLDSERYCVKSQEKPIYFLITDHQLARASDGSSVASPSSGGATLL